MWLIGRCWDGRFGSLFLDSQGSREGEDLGPEQVTVTQGLHKSMPTAGPTLR